VLSNFILLLWHVVLSYANIGCTQHPQNFLNF